MNAGAPRDRRTEKHVERYRKGPHRETCRHDLARRRLTTAQLHNTDHGRRRARREFGRRTLERALLGSDGRRSP
jgi:hypothetical protein